MKNTMIEMVTELEKLSHTKYVEILISKARAGEFHDYRSPAACGKMYAVQCIDHTLKHDNHLPSGDVLNLQKIRQDIIEGEYDEPFTKEDEIHVHREMDNDPTISEKDKAFFRSVMVAR